MFGWYLFTIASRPPPRSVSDLFKFGLKIDLTALVIVSNL